ncbi:MAG: diaminopimelate epimerase [Rikenellaceae bacterium]
MQNFEFILCHGSANRFVMIDTIAQPFEVDNLSQFIQKIALRSGSDGVLLLTKWGEKDMAMRMFNTDGSEAEMCGNGMRCIARLADERYLHAERFTLYSGGRAYEISREKMLADGVPTYGVKIAVATASPEFTLEREQFIGESIEELDPQLKFTYLNLGNPHIVAMVDEIDLEHLSLMGERVKELKHIFTRGVNVSTIQKLGEQQIFVATYERGVGLTASCGTAMTASSTATTLLGLCQRDKDIEVRNRGGFVRCRCHKEGEDLYTWLIGNATYELLGEITPDGEIVVKHRLDREIGAWDTLVK